MSKTLAKALEQLNALRITESKPRIAQLAVAAQHAPPGTALQTRLEGMLLGELARATDPAGMHPFLDIPPTAAGTDGIYLALQKSNGQPIMISQARSILVTATAGAGKTTFTHHVALQARAAGLHVIWFDPKDDARWIAVRDPQCVIMDRSFPWGALGRVPYLTIAEQIAVTTACFTKAFYGAEHQRQVTNEALHLLYARSATPSFVDLLETILSLAKKGDTYQRVEAIRGAAARVQRLIEQYDGLAKTNGGIKTERLVTECSVHFGSAIHNDVSEFLHALLTWHVFQYNRAHQRRNQPTHLIVNDEALLAHSTTQQRLEESSLTTLAAMGREFGLVFLTTTLNLAMTSPLLKSTAYVHVALPLSNSADTHEVSKLLGLSPQQHTYLEKRLTIPECIIKIAGGGAWREPILALIPPPTHDKTVNAADWEAAKERALALLPPPPPPRLAMAAGAPQPASPNPSNPIALNAAERSLLEAIGREPCMPCTYYYKRCSLHLQVGDRARKKLETLGLLEVEPMIVRAGRGGKGIGLRITKEAARLGIKSTHGLRGHSSIQHEFLARRIAKATNGNIELMLGTKSIDVVVRYSAAKYEGFLAVLLKYGTPLAPMISLNDGDLIGVEVEVSAPERSAHNVLANHNAGIALNVIAVLPKVLKKTVDALRSTLEESLYSRVIIINVFTIIDL